MGEVGGFRSKYERAEFAEMANASLAELEALEKKYDEVLAWNEYAFSKNAEEEGHKIFSRLLVGVRAKISEVKSANENVKSESEKRRGALSNEIKEKKPRRDGPSRSETVRTKKESPSAENQVSALTDVPLAPDSPKPNPAMPKKADVDGFAWGVRWAFKDMGDSASKIFGNSK